MKRIHKYELPINGGIKTICDPIEKVLDIQCQGNFPVMWAEVDLEKESKSMDVIAIGTGWEYEANEVGEYLGTAQDGYGYVWHYFVYKPLEMEKAPTEEEQVTLIDGLAVLAQLFGEAGASMGQTQEEFCKMLAGKR